MRGSLPLAFSLVVLSAVLPAQNRAGALPRQQTPEWREFAALYHRLVEQHGVVGSSIALVADGTVVAQEHYGSQGLDPQVPVDADTAFHWASITKTFTAVAILQLRDEGRLSLDDPVVHHLPELRRVHSPFGPMDRITIRHLLSHSAGFRGPTWPWGGDRPWHPFEPTEWEQLVAMLPYTEVEFEPGSRYRYSNPGIVFLGRIIELLTGEDYETYMEKNVLRPLGMGRSYFDRAPRHLRRHRSHSFHRKDGTLRTLPFDFDTGITVSNGGLNAPVSDLARWVAFLLGSSREPMFDEVLARRSLEEMFQPVLPLAARGADRPAMGLGFFLERHQELDFVAHSGGQNGFVSHFYVCPEAGRGYVVAFNTNAQTSPGHEPLQNTSELDRLLREEMVRRFFHPTEGAAPPGGPADERAAAAPVEPAVAGPPQITARAWVIADGTTGRVLAGKDEDRPSHAASTTKIMCARVVLGFAAEDPKVLEQIVTISEAAARTPGSTAEVEPGDRLSVHDLLHGLLLPSGNDAGVALAEHFGAQLAPASGAAEAAADSPRARFIQAMNREAGRLGLHHTTYRSPFGDGGNDQQLTTTARDLALLASSCLQEPRFRSLVATRTYDGTATNPLGTARTITWRNTNRLLGEDGCDGVKTGTTRSAGACLVASFRRDGRHLLTVVLGSTDDAARYADTRALIAWAWDRLPD